jgi:glutathione S-transferase
MSGKLTLYYTLASMPSRAVLLLARYLDIALDLKNVDLASGENRKEWFEKLNPAKTIPVLVDGNFILAESRAILSYLVNTKKPESPLIPKDAKTRALMDQRLYYDATIVFPSFRTLLVTKELNELFGLINEIFFQTTVIFDNSEGGKKSAEKGILNSLKCLEAMLGENEYFAGTDLTLADFSILPNVTCASVRVLFKKK